MIIFVYLQIIPWKLHKNYEIFVCRKSDHGDSKFSNTFIIMYHKEINVLIQFHMICADVTTIKE